MLDLGGRIEMQVGVFRAINIIITISSNLSLL